MIAVGSRRPRGVPKTLLDSRTGVGTSRAEVHGGGTVTLRVTGLPLPAKVSAVLLNVAVTNPTAAGVVVVFPHGGPNLPSRSSIFVAGQTVANLVGGAGQRGRHRRPDRRRTDHDDDGPAGRCVRLLPVQLLRVPVRATGGVAPSGAVGPGEIMNPWNTRIWAVPA